MPEPPANQNTENASKTSEVNKEDDKKAPVESSLTDQLNKKLLSSFLNRINEAEDSENSVNPGQNPNDFESNDDEW
ncbi:hypothetical protein M8J77_014259 [Diaphorina citri]|nr:hypothetical protein M8J77_014259 [Diaphorina citri]